MMNFPSSPTPGSIYSPSGGPSYTWDGQKWVMTGSSITYTPAYDQRNRVVNGGFQISQENGTTSLTTTSTYPADQWMFSFSGMTSVSTARTIGTTAEGAASGLRCTVVTAKPSLAAGDTLFFNQRIEGIRVADFAWGGGNALPIVLRFSFYAPAAGTYGVAIRNGANNRSWVGAFTVAAATWTKQKISIPGDTTGTWAIDNSVGLEISFTFACGTTYTAPALGWNAGNYIAPPGMSNGASATGVFYIGDVGLYLDPTGSGIAPAWEMPDEAAELIACQRYWRPSPSALAPWNTATTTAYAYAAIYPEMRVAATTALSASPVVNEFGVSSRAVSAIATASLTPSHMQLNLTTAAASAVGKMGGLLTGSAIFNARM